MDKATITAIMTTLTTLTTLLQGELTTATTATLTTASHGSKAKEKTLTVNRGTEEAEKTISNVVYTAWRHSYTDGKGTEKHCICISGDRKTSKQAWKALLSELQAIDKGAYYSKYSHAFVFQSPTATTEKALRARFGTIKKTMPADHADYIEKRRAHKA